MRAHRRVHAAAANMFRTWNPLEIVDNIVFGGEIGAAGANVAIVIEAAPEKEDLKRDIFRDL
jgi:3-hydroxyacyl-CoA dehydrogenase